MVKIRIKIHFTSSGLIKSGELEWIH